MKARSLTALLVPFILAGAPVLAAESHDHAAPDMKGAMKDATKGAAKGKGVVNSVDAAGHKVNMSHDPIPALGWPAMKMDFAVAPTVDLSAVQPGSAVDFTVGKNQAGLPEIQSIQARK